MKSKLPLYLASSSQSRQMLLKQCNIPFVLAPQEADESKCDWNLELPEVVKNIARYKMEHVVLPAGTELPPLDGDIFGEIFWVLTADTLTCDAQGTIHGKPTSRDDAISKLKALRNGQVITGTAFCLERKKYANGAWHTQEQIIEYVEGRYHFQVPDAWLDEYLEHSIGLNGSGAIGIEEYGAQFLKDLEGSHSAVMGLPLFELRESLQRLNYY